MDADNIDVEAWLSRFNQNESLSPPAFKLLCETLESVPDVLLPLALEIATQDPGSLATAMQNVVAGSRDLDLLLHLASNVPLRTLNLAQFAPVLDCRILSLLAAESGGLTEVQLREAEARHSNNLAIRLMDCRSLTEALANSERAVRVFEELADRHPGRFLPDLAAALNTQAVILSHAGKLDHAIQKADEALGIYRDLIREGDLRYQENLALALKNRSDRLGHYDSRLLAIALRDAEESVEIYSSLVANGKNLPGLAAALISLANRLLSSDRTAEALHRAQLANEIYDYLQAKDRDEFLPALGSCLLSVLHCHIAAQARHEALRIARIALRVFVLLRKQDSQTYSEDYRFLTQTIGALEQEQHASTQA